MSAGDPYIAALEYKISLKPGEEKSYAFFAGIGFDTLEGIKAKYKSAQDAYDEMLFIRKDWKKKLSLDIPSIKNKIFLVI